jgi:hypothetical protein
MPVRKKLRRIRRLSYLGILIGVVVALRKAKVASDARPGVGPLATWPPLQPGEPPVAAVGDLAAEPSPTPVAVRSGAESSAPQVPVASDEPVAAVGDVAAEMQAAAWVAPEDGACPATHTVKANANSGIYHLPGGQFYERTRPERCYVDAAAAEADGYRAAKSSEPKGGPAS